MPPLRKFFFLLHPDQNQGGGEDTDAADAGDGVTTDNDDQSAVTDDDKVAKAELDKVLATLAKERDARKAAERAAKNQNRTVEERIADIEKRNEELELKALLNDTLDKLLDAVPEGHAADRKAVLELLEDVNLNADNMEAAVAKRVKAAMKPVAVKAAGATNPTPDAGKQKYDWDNLPSASELY